MGNVRPGTDCIGQNTDALSAATASRVDEADADRHAPAVLAEETATRVWYLDFQDKGCDSAARAQRFLHTRLFCASWGACALASKRGRCDSHSTILCRLDRPSIRVHRQLVFKRRGAWLGCLASRAIESGRWGARLGAGWEMRTVVLSFPQPPGVWSSGVVVVVPSTCC